MFYWLNLSRFQNSAGHLNTEYCAPQSRHNAKLFLQSSELGLPQPLTAGECSPPLLVPGGRGTLAGKRGGGRVPIPTRGHTPYVLCGVLPTLMYRKKAHAKKSFCWSSEAGLLQPGSGHLHQQQAGEDHGSVLFSIALKPVLRIHDILVWIRIRIRGSMPLTNGSGCGSGSCTFHHWPSIRQQKTNFLKSFSAYYFLKVHLHHFSKIKSQKEVTKQ